MINIKILLIRSSMPHQGSQITPQNTPVHLYRLSLLIQIFTEMEPDTSHLFKGSLAKMVG